MTKSHYAVVYLTLAGALLINLAAMYLRTDAQANLNRAGLVVRYPDGSVTKRCVTFAEPAISGYDLLRRANVQVVADVAGGGTICRIGATGCNFPAQQCFCECQDLNQTCIYWIYYFEANGAWKYSSLGAPLQKVTNGSVNGWAYGAGSGSSGGIVPPYLTLDQICGTAAVTPSAAPSASPSTVAQVIAKSLPGPTVTPLVASETKSLATATAVAVAGPTATSAPAATSMPTAAATSTSGPMPASMTAPAPSATLSAPAVTPTAAADTPNNVSAGGYLAFGGIAVGLIVVLVITRLNTGRSSS